MAVKSLKYESLFLKQDLEYSIHASPKLVLRFPPHYVLPIE